MVFILRGQATRTLWLKQKSSKCESGGTVYTERLKISRLRACGFESHLSHQKEYMNERVQEILDILQEECGEVIVEVSKCRRFGLDSVHYKTGELHQDMLTQELGDVLAMMRLLVESGVVSMDALEAAGERKIEKLRKWSNIFKS
jgi:NTP pyrophosphatase (non-canonical NTP hydrolase)